MTRYPNPHMLHQQHQQRQVLDQRPMSNMPHTNQNNMQLIPLGNNMFQLPNGVIVQMTNSGYVQVNPNMMPMQGNMNPGMMPMQGNMNPGMMPMQGNMNPGMMPMQGNMNPGMMPMQGNMNFQPNADRFGTAINNVTNGLSITSQENNSIGSRYQSSQENTTMSTKKPAATSPFTVNIEKNIKYGDNNRVLFNTYIEEVKDSQINNLINSTSISDCFDEAVESIIESANEKTNNKLITIQNLILSNSYYKTISQSKFNDLILVNDVKSIYKTLKVAFTTLSNVYDINFINSFDSILTYYVNEYVKVNANINVSIDSFMTDFNDLLKIVRNNEEELEDNLINYMDNFIKEIKDNINVVNDAYNEEEKNNATYIPENCSMCYVDKLSKEIGINDIDYTYVKIDNNIANTFILTLADKVCDKLSSNCFYLITIDKVIVKIMKNLNNVSFIKAIS